MNSFPKTISVTHALIDLYTFSFYLVNGLVLSLLLLGSALISGAEAAFFSLTHQQIAQCRSKQVVQDSKVLKILQSPTRLLATILILNNLINVAFIILSTHLLWQTCGMRNVRGLVWLAYTLISSTIIVLFGEIMPKTYASQHSLWAARKVAAPLNGAMLALQPLANMLMRLSKLFGQVYLQEPNDLSVDQLNRAVEIVEDWGTAVGEGAKAALKGVVNFKTLMARQIMQPRTEITAIDMALDFRRLIDTINKSGYSRFPVYQETIDQITGFLYTKDLLPYLDEGKHFPWHSLLRRCLFVPENKKLDTLLFEFQKGKVHMAIVVDEYGGTSGLLTMEDVLEEIIGDITDEFDQDEEVMYRQLDSDIFEFQGKVLLHDFCKVIAISPTVFEAIKGKSESLGGLLLEVHGRLPSANEKIRYKQFTFTVLAVDARKIKKVNVHIGHEPVEQVAALR